MKFSGRRRQIHTVKSVLLLGSSSIDLTIWDKSKTRRFKITQKSFGLMWCKTSTSRKNFLLYNLRSFMESVFMIIFCKFWMFKSKYVVCMLLIARASNAYTQFDSNAKKKIKRIEYLTDFSSLVVASTSLFIQRCRPFHALNSRTHCVLIPIGAVWTTHKMFCLYVRRNLWMI